MYLLLVTELHVYPPSTEAVQVGEETTQALPEQVCPLGQVDNDVLHSRHESASKLPQVLYPVPEHNFCPEEHSLVQVGEEGVRLGCQLNPELVTVID